MSRKKFRHQKDQLFYVIKEDTVGWYLIAYLNRNEDKSSHDYLLDTFDEALIEAEERFGIPKNYWEFTYEEAMQILEKAKTQLLEI